MGIIRSNDPAVFDDLDGIVVDESAPAPSIRGAATNVAILVGQFERGPLTLQSIGSTGQLHQLYGKSYTFSGNKALMNKKFGALKVIRALASAAVAATKTFDDGAAEPADIITFTAKYKGAYGNSIKVTIEAGTTSGKKYTIEDTSTNVVLPKEIYDNVEVASIDDNGTFNGSLLVDVTVVATTSEPAVASATSLASGSDGTIADTDYQTAIAVAEAENAGNILFLDDYNATRNGYLKTHAAATTDKVCILAGALTETKSDAITAVANCRDTEGRLVYAFNPVQTTINGSSVYTNPASWLASILSQTHPSVDPAFAKNVQYTAGATGLKYTLSYTDYKELMVAGICAFENDQDLGIKPKSGVVTQITDSSKLMIFRRRMADFLTTSAAKFLKNYQNAVNSKENRIACKGAVLNFVGAQERLGVLPKDSEVKEGVAKLVDVDSPNTDLTIGQGYFYLLWKQRIYGSMRFIVLRAEIGETVVVTAQ